MENLFEISTSKSYDAGKLDLQKTKSEIDCFEFIGRTKTNYGLQGYVRKQDKEPNLAGVISISQIGEVNAQIRKELWYSSQNIFILTPQNENLVNNYVITCINKFLTKYGKDYTYYPTLKSLNQEKITLPTTAKGTIDFSYMENYIAELEAERIAELEAYLKVTGLNNYTLTKKEHDAIDKILSDKIEYKEFRIGNLFERISTNKLPYKAKDLPEYPKDKFILPCLTSSFKNQGLNYYVPKDNATILKNVITIPSNSDIYRAYFQSNDFTVLSDAYAIKWNEENELSEEQYLFMVSCINKVTDLPIYSYKNKLGGWNRASKKYISLPTKNGKIDYDFMKDVICGIQKLVIKGVVQYKDKLIDTTKQVILK